MSKYILPTFTGKLFDLQNPTEDMICIEDIAHHLSIENRFNGSTRFPYSVGYHSICVANFTSEEFKLEALLHDATEAYCKDLTSPLKNLLREDDIVGSNNYYKIEHLISEKIFLKFNLNISTECWNAIKNIDLRMATTEVEQLLKYFPQENWCHHKDFSSYDIQIQKLSAENVEELFLKEYEKLRRI